MERTKITGSDRSASVVNKDYEPKSEAVLQDSQLNLQPVNAYVCTGSDMNTSSDKDASEQRVFLDTAPVALSKSVIFPLLEQYYKSGGKVLWEQIPYYVTSNPNIASAYADIIISFLLDCRRRIEKNEPIYIIEMGTGTGCFSFYLLKELSRKIKMFDAVRSMKLKYVMCDFSTNTIQSWIDSDYFTQFRQEGLLDFAVFKPEEQDEITTHSGIQINAKTVRNPVLAIANYFFDSLRQDAFQVRNHKLHASLHHFYASGDLQKLEQAPLTFASLKKVEQYEPVHGTYYDNPVLNSILSRYEGEMHDATILFPLGALRCLENLRVLSNGNLALLSSDKGLTAMEDMAGLFEQPYFSHDGIFSYSVNYDAIRKYFDEFDGYTLATNMNDYPIETAVCVMFNKRRKSALKLEHTTFCFQERLLWQNVINDPYECQRLFLQLTKDELLTALISFIRANNYDPISLYLCADKVMRCLTEMKQCSCSISKSLLETLKRVEDNYFHIRNKYNVFYYIGRIRLMLNDVSGALSILVKCAEIAKDDSDTLCKTFYYIAFCYEKSDKFDLAFDFYRRSFELDSECQLTAAAIERVKPKIA